MLCLKSRNQNVLSVESLLLMIFSKYILIFFITSQLGLHGCYSVCSAYWLWLQSNDNNSLGMSYPFLDWPSTNVKEVEAPDGVSLYHQRRVFTWDGCMVSSQLSTLYISGIYRSWPLWNIIHNLAFIPTPKNSLELLFHFSGTYYPWSNAENRQMQRCTVLKPNMHFYLEFRVHEMPFLK